MTAAELVVMFEKILSEEVPSPLDRIRIAVWLHDSAKVHFAEQQKPTLAVGRLKPEPEGSGGTDDL